MRTMSNATRLAAYLEAEAAVLRMQAFSLEGRQVTRANLAEIRTGIAELRRAVAAETAAAQGRPSGYAVAEFK